MSRYRVNVGGFVTVYRERNLTIHAKSKEEAIEKALDKYDALQRASGGDLDRGTINNIDEILGGNTEC